MKTWILILVLATGIVAKAQTTSTNAAAFDRVKHLQHGINASMWFAQSPGYYSVERLRSFTTEDDIRMMRKLGFDHVRLSIDPEPLAEWVANPSAPNAFLGEIDRVVKAILDQKLAVIIDIHPEDGYKAQLRQGPESTDRFAVLWTALAKHFAATNPELVYFEVMNEPEQNDLSRWREVETRAAQAIRAAAPKHTIIATGAHWSSLYDLMEMEPLPLDNVIYTFHDYDPLTFTHQGATWSSPELKPLRTVPYPSTPEAVQTNVGQESSLIGQWWVTQYGLDRWDAQRLDATVAFAQKWGQVHHVPVYCGEFGVFREYSDPAMRAQWIHDMRTALEKHGIGWAMWDYQEAFGIVTKKDGKTVPDEGVVEALGLKTPN